jgi:pyrimidine and pyridine-specific 5'-nucleotidase
MERSVVCVVAKEKSEYYAGVNGSWEDVEELEAGEGGEGWDSDLVDAMKKLDEKGVRRAVRGLRTEECVSLLFWF